MIIFSITNRQYVDRKTVLEMAEKTIKKYNIPKDQILSDRVTLRWLFVENRNDDF